MSKLISLLLGAKEPAFSLAIKQMEEITGRQGIDVKLTAEILTKIRMAAGQLGLDPADTTAKELYYGLMNKIKADDERFNALIIGGHMDDEPRQLLQPVVRAVGSLDMPKKCWVIKKSVAKEMLKKTPPKNIMKHLHYKSIDSLLKNESIFEIYGALRFAESAAWLEQFNKHYQSLTPSDFEIRNIEILAIPEDRWAELALSAVIKKGHFVTNLKELGAIIILPPARPESAGFATLLALLLIYYLNEIRTYSSFFKLQQVKPDFSKQLAKTLNNDSAHVAIIGGQPIHWRIVQHHYGKNRKNQPELFEPHLQYEDLQWQKAEKTLAKLDPEFAWWQGMDYVGLKSGKATVSLSLMDVVLNYYLQSDFENSSDKFLHNGLWNELFSRYMGEKVLEQQVLRQLDIEMLEEDTIYDTLQAGGFK